MNRALIWFLCLTLLVIGQRAYGNPESLSQFAMRQHTFVWDSGSEPFTADPDDIFFDWAVPCEKYVPTVFYQQESGAECLECHLEIARLQSLLNEYQLEKETFNGSLLRARLGDTDSPLFVLAPSVHPLTWLDRLEPTIAYDRFYALYLSNILDFLRIVDLAEERRQSVSNVSEMMNLLVDSSYLKLARQTISATIYRNDYLSDEDWVEAILQKGLVDASTFLVFAFEDSQMQRDLPIEAQDSFINSVLLNTTLALRYRMSVTSEETLYDAFSAEYELGLTYFGSLKHRFSGSLLMEGLRKNWGLFKRYSQLTEESLHQAALSNCEQRSRNMADELMELVRTKRTDYYLVSFGPLHLHGVLMGLEKNRLSYLLIAPSPFRSSMTE
jgi:hypothetical protein